MKKKILNDPIYGFLTIPTGIISELVEHRFYQRLRRITQLGLTHYVYPGALHTRFHHSLGALYLTNRAISVLRSKGIDITEEEAEGVQIAVLLHDIGHGSFSHALEHLLIDISHEELSIAYMELLNHEFDGKLSLAMSIFKGDYPKKYLHQLVSSQLDMDRMDYLTRDQFFTGVSEGVIGYDRIIEMLDVKENELVFEEKAIFSIEKFLIARKIMYWQVYLHKTVICAEQMLISTIKRAKYLHQSSKSILTYGILGEFLQETYSRTDFLSQKTAILQKFSLIDDVDVLFALKTWANQSDFILSSLSKSIINRNLFKVLLKNEPFESDQLKEVRQNIVSRFKLESSEDVKYFVLCGTEKNTTYNTKQDQIKILLKNGDVQPITKFSDFEVLHKTKLKYFLCYPR